MYRVQVGAAVGLCALLAWGAAANGQPAPTANPAAAKAFAEAQQDLQAAFPGVQLQTDGTRTLAVYGKPMTAAETPDQAAQWWLDDHAPVLGVAAQDLLAVSNHEVSLGKFTVFAYKQMMDGLPVERGRAKVLVLNGQPNEVVYVGARLAQAPEKGFRPDALDAEAALAAVRQMPAYAGLTEWTAPEKVVYYGEGDGGLITPVRAWKFLGHNKNLSAYAAYTFFVGAADGTLVYVRDEIYYADVDGHVSGMASPGVLPDVPSNPEQEMDLEALRVRIQGGNIVFTDENGNYVIPDGAGLVTVIADIQGRWVDVNNNVGSDLQLSEDVTPPATVDFLFNASPADLNTSQVNGYIHATSTHDFFKDRAPGFNGLDTPLPCNVNLNDTCNAYFTFPLSINFFQSGGGCVNTAYSTVIAHEYGHFVVNQLGLAQNAFGEGFGDCVAVLQYNDGIVGRNFCGSLCNVRNIPGANQQYPCFDEIHTCGQVLAGVWWDIKLNMQATYGSTVGLDMTRQMFVDWAMITEGEDPTGQAAHPQTAIEVLTVDDDDGDLENGTPNYQEICGGFSAHSIDCPAILAIVFEYPLGRPEVVEPSQTSTIRVNALPGASSPVPGTGTISYRIGTAGSFTTDPMTELHDNEYEGTLPAADCGETIQYYFTVDQSGGGTASDPSDAPTTTYTTISATGVDSIVDFNFETAPGWSVSGTAADGQWDRGVPVDCNRGDPSADEDGSGQCWLTDNSAASSCNSDVDDGTTILTSPNFDLSATNDAVLTYARWYSNDRGSAPEEDTFVVEISDNGGASWVGLETVGPSGDEVHGGWYVKSFHVADYVALTNQVRVRFLASDLGSGSIVEAAIDAFKIADYRCDLVALPGDLDGDGDVDLTDFALFSQCFAGADNPPAVDCPSGVDADLDGDGDVDLDDFAIFAQNFTGSL